MGPCKGLDSESTASVTCAAPRLLSIESFAMAAATVAKIFALCPSIEGFANGAYKFVLKLSVDSTTIACDGVVCHRRNTIICAVLVVQSAANVYVVKVLPHEASHVGNGVRHVHLVAAFIMSHQTSRTKETFVLVRIRKRAQI